MALQEEFEKEGNRLFRYRNYLPLLLLAAALIVYQLTLFTNGGNYPRWYAYYYCPLNRREAYPTS